MANWLTKFLTAVAVLFLAVHSFGQGVVYSNTALAPTTNTNNSPARFESFATIRVCTEPASGSTCSPLASIYSNAGLTTPLTNPFSSDQYGNFLFYAAPGTYHIQVSGPGLAQYDIPYQSLGNGQGSVTSVNTASPLAGGPITTNGTISCPTCLTTGNLSLASPPPIGSTTPNSGTFTSVNNVIMADAQAGADACAKINTAVGLLSATGGVIDAQGFQGTQTCSTSNTITLSKPVHLKLGAIILQAPQVQISAAGVKISGISQQTAGSFTGTNSTTIQSNAAKALIYVTSGGSYIVEDLNLDGNSSTGLIGLFDPLWSNGTVRNVKVYKFANNGIYMRGGLNKIHDLVTAYTGGDGVVLGSDSLMDGYNEITYGGQTISGKGGVHVFAGGTRITYVMADYNTGYGVNFDATVDPDWQSLHAYQIGDEQLPTSGNAGNYIYIATNTGTSGGAAPTWTQSSGALVSDGGVTWIATKDLKIPGYNIAIMNGNLSYNTGAALLVQGSATYQITGFQAGTILTDFANNSTTSSVGVHLIQGFMAQLGDIHCYGSGGLKNDIGCLVIDGSANTIVSSVNSFQTHKNAIQVINGSVYTHIQNALIQNNADSTTTSTDRYGVYLASGTSYTTLDHITIFDTRGGSSYSAGIYNFGANNKIANYVMGSSLITGTNLPNDFELVQADFVDNNATPQAFSFRTWTNYIWDGTTGWTNNRSALDRNGFHAPAFCSLYGSLTDAAECMSDDGLNSLTFSAGTTGIKFQNNAHGTTFGSIANSTGILNWLNPVDLLEISTPANPAVNTERLYADSTAHTLKCLTSSGGNCLPVGTAGFSGTKTAGACTFTIVNGLITNVTGC